MDNGSELEGCKSTVMMNVWVFRWVLGVRKVPNTNDDVDCLS